MERPESGTYIDNLPEKLYHNKEHGYSSSDLKSILKKTPYHFKYDYDLPNAEPTGPMKIGSVLHAHLLRADEFFDEIIMMPEYTGKGCTEKKALFKKQNSDLLVVTNKEFDLGISMSESCQKNDEVMELLEGSIKERSMYGEVLEIPVRARQDAYKGRVLIELKSCLDASEDGFGKQVANLNYHVSLIHYACLMEICLDHIESLLEVEYKFICVENTPPYAVAIRVPTEKMLAVGLHLWKDALQKLCHGVETGVWPGYTSEDEPGIVDVPRWSIPIDMEE